MHNLKCVNAKWHVSVIVFYKDVYVLAAVMLPTLVSIHGAGPAQLGCVF